MNLLIYILLFNFIGSIVSLLGALFLLLLNKKHISKIATLLSAFAAGTLLGTVFFDLLPEALEEGVNNHIESHTVFFWVLLGILFFFLLERFLHYFHHHEFTEKEIGGKPVVALIAIGDTVHNFVDGIAIAATFIVSIPLGIVTSVAVGAHEIPQEIGDFGVLIKSGLSKKRVIAINVLSAMASFAGAILMYTLGERFESLSVIFLSLAAGFFLYVSLSDIIPEIHSENKKGWAAPEIVSLLSGVGMVYLALFIIQTAFHINP